ncbi:MAG TPA: LysM domain-containing protein, partial [Polyangiaceae bacterium]|nr:LysM domain-containing protein [Polyangiaceae bacterium]
MLRRLSLGASILACLVLSGQVLAQAGPSPSPAAAPSNPGEGGGATPAPAAAAAPAGGGTTVVQTTPNTVTRYGFGPSMEDLNKGLPSSSRSRTGDETDSFDLAPGNKGAGVVYGTAGSTGVLGPQRALEVPPIHVVRKGDTLWDLCDSYYANPWGWPKVWSYNPQIVNPHWIYPGDQIRMRDVNDQQGQGQRRDPLASTTIGAPVRGSKHGVPPSTVFLRDHGFLGDPKRDLWGELVGAVEDQMLLSDGNHVYLMMRPGVQVSPGQSLTIFTSLRKAPDVPGARNPPGEIVSVKGTVKIDQFNEKTRVARGELTESLDVIERGFKIGPVGRSFDVVPPKPAAKNVQARVLTSLYPHTIMGQNQVVFLDRGSEDGLGQGTRMFILRQGDSWRDSLNVGNDMLKSRMKIDSAKSADVERTPMDGSEKEFPSEVTAELRVIRAEK